MTITTLSSREFNQDAGRAKKAARSGPVIITDRGRPMHVLLSMEDYRRLTGAEASIVDRLAMPAAGAIDFAPPRSKGLYRPLPLVETETAPDAT
jgi:prevent-host-death family protein